MNTIQWLSGFFILQLISTVIFIIGYFQSPQSLTLQSGKVNPFFERNDWFVPQFSRIVAIINNDQDRSTLDKFMNNNQSYHQSFEIDFSIYTTQEDLLNILMRGVNPISLLQYGLVEMDRWDSIPHQINRQGKQFCLSSDNNYDEEYIDVINSIRITNLSQIQLSQYDGCQLIYIDNNDQDSESLLSSMETTWIQESSSNKSTLFIFLEKPTEPKMLFKQTQYGTLWFLSGQQLLGQSVRESFNMLINPIDSIASSLACLLNIPIPIQNNGLILPGVYYKSKLAINDTLISTPELAQFYFQLVGLEQLSIHLYLLNKFNPLFVSQQQKKAELESMLDQYIVKTKADVLIDLITQTRLESYRINVWLNESISGNPFVMSIGIILSLISFGLVISKLKDQPNSLNTLIVVRNIDKIILLLIIIIASIQRKHQLFVSSVALIGFIGSVISQLSFISKLKILFQISAVLFYLNFPDNPLSFIIQIVMISMMLYFLSIFFVGLWIHYTSTGSANNRLLLLSCCLVSILSYVPIPQVKLFMYFICLILSVYQFSKSLDMNMTSNVVIFLLLNFAYLNDKIPLSLIASIVCISYIEVVISQSNTEIEHQEHIILKPISAVIYLVVYQSSLSQLPQSPLILEYREYLVQIYCALIYIFVRNFTAMVCLQSSNSMAIRRSFSVYSRSVVQSLSSHLEQSQTQFQDLLISQGVLLLFNWFFVFMNEVFHYDTRPENLGQEYYYMQDSVSYLFFVLCILGLLHLPKQQASQTNIELPQHSEEVEDIQL